MSGKPARTGGRQSESAGNDGLAKLVGSRARLEVILLLGGVLALDGADKATVGAIATPLKQALDIGNIQIGLLVTVSTAVGALATLPLGAMVDRMHRVRLLTAAILIWSVATLISGFSNSYLMLLVTRLALGAVVATAAPAVASLTGDFFPAAERGRIWGFLLGGELAGSAFGLAASGLIAGWVSWRAAFWLMGLLGIGLGVLLYRRLPEPQRGGMSRLPPGDSAFDTNEDEPSIGAVIDAADEVDTPAAPDIQRDPARLSFRQSIAYLLSIRSNVLLIVASALGYFFFTGLRTFGVVFMGGRFSLDQSWATLATIGLGMGSIVGVLVAGRLADRLIGKGYFNARVIVPAVAFFLCAAFLIPGVLATTLWITGPFFFVSAASLGATNPALDAGRMDIVHSRVWGLGESLRTFLRYLFEAAAPLAFGYMATLFGSASGAFAAEHKVAEDAQGLAWTLLLMSSALIAAGILLFFARRYYPQDVANALAAERNSGSN